MPAVHLAPPSTPHFCLAPLLPFRRTQSFVHARAKYDCTQMSSFMEKRAMAMISKYSKEWVQHNVHKLSRIYPSGLRIDSTNYNPQPLWNAGCQLVSLNFQVRRRTVAGGQPRHAPPAHLLPACFPHLHQTPSLATQLNNAMFSINGRSGYVLKPKCMRMMKSSFSPLDKGKIYGVFRETLKLSRWRELRRPCMPASRVSTRAHPCTLSAQPSFLGATFLQRGASPSRWNSVDFLRTAR